MIRLSNAQSWREVTGGRVTPSVFFRGIIERLKKKRRLKIAGKDRFSVGIPFFAWEKVCLFCLLSSPLFLALRHFTLLQRRLLKKTFAHKRKLLETFKKAKSLSSKICFRKRTKIRDNLMQIFRIYLTYLEQHLDKCCVTPRLLSIPPSLAPN